MQPTKLVLESLSVSCYVFPDLRHYRGMMREKEKKYQNIKEMFKPLFQCEIKDRRQIGSECEKSVSEREREREREMDESKN